jgi:arginyl-tRNA synthetase
VNSPKILEEKNENTKNIRLNIIDKTAKTLKLGFALLAIEMPNEM